MHGQIKTWDYDKVPKPRTIWGQSGDVWLECELTSPKSMVGRNVDIRIPQEVVAQLMLTLKKHAIEVRL